MASGIFWPTELKPSPSGVVRLGRVLHWTCAAWAIFWAVSAAYMLIQSDGDYGAFYVFVGFAVLAAVAGRAVRYILAGE